MVYLQLIVNDRDYFFKSVLEKPFCLSRSRVALFYCLSPTNGAVNTCLENYLRCMTGNTPHQWSRWLSLAKWWYNTNYHSSIWSGTTTSYFLLSSRLQHLNELLTKRENMLQLLEEKPQISAKQNNTGG